ncbi:hypothetical protein AM587_10007016 [Phytophthora nicotianae]|uniref:Uncharacterized protein n=1 Tax=Phytophthora nicotianae TaxID=4792 RepID=A0A0W8CUJ7_PHYNI|nr:hypothetical protein AM587_10007016 [Phytophthora nicotianae]
MSPQVKDGNAPRGIVYTLVPAQPLPVVDLSKSFRGRLLPAKVHTFIRRKYYKHYRPVLVCGVLSYCLNVVIPLVEARMGRIIAVLAALLWIPIGLGSITTLRYDIVRLVFRTFDFWFFSAITSTITVTMSMYFGDLRSVRMLIDWIGYHHVVFVDAHVLGLRSLTYFLIATVLSVCVVLVWIMLGKVDGGSTFTIVKYEILHRTFELTGLDVIGNGMVSLGFLVAKIVFRRRKVLRVKRRRSSGIVECVIYRCRLKLERRDGPSVALAWPSEDSRYQSKEASLRNPEEIQNLMFVKFPQMFQATNTLLQCCIPKQISFPNWFLVIFYIVGAAGLILSHIPGSELFAAQELKCLVPFIALLCTAIFTGLFVVFYQRELLKLLFTSFDFAFYSFQITGTDIGACILYNWNMSRCLMILSWWLWAQWAFTLDALTPATRHMLKFHVRFAAPVLCLLLFDHLRIIYRIFLGDDTELHDSIIFEGTIWNHHLVLRLIPFYISRSLTLSIWCSRLISRLASATDESVSILRGTVSYDNIFSRGRRRSSHMSRIVEVKALASALSRRTRVSPVASFCQEKPLGKQNQSVVT